MGHGTPTRSTGSLGTLGQGPSGPTRSTVPLQVGGLANVTWIAAGGYHAMAAESNGTVYGWGDITYNNTGAPTCGTA